MLKINKTTTLNGTSEIDGMVIANMTTNIGDDININTNVYVCNNDLYNENKSQVRADIDEFTEIAYQMQDEENL